MFTARILGIEDSNSDNRYIAIHRLNEMKNELTLSQLSTKQLLLDDINLLLNVIREKKPSSFHELLCAARLDKMNENPIFTRALLNIGAQFKREDVEHIIKVNPAAANTIGLRRKTMAKL